MGTNRIIRKFVWFPSISKRKKNFPFMQHSIFEIVFRIE